MKSIAYRVSRTVRKFLASGLVAVAAVGGLEAAPEGETTVTQSDLQALMKRLADLEAVNRAQAERIARLERIQKENAESIAAYGLQATQLDKSFKLQTEKISQMQVAGFKAGGAATTNSTGRVYTTPDGKHYYLADVTSGIFEPLSESGFQITPYGYLVFEGVYTDRPLDADWATDFVMPHGQQSESTLSVQDSILGIRFNTPESYAGWRFSGKAEFDLAGGNQNAYAFHWRHLYVDAAHESGWSILFGQTWHLWKLVTPSEIDGAWMENAGHPYRRSPQLRVSKRWDWDDSALDVRVGIVKGGPGMGGDRDGDAIQDNSASPWVLFEGAVSYERALPWQNREDKLQTQRGLIGIGGMYGRDRSYRYNGVTFNDDLDDYDSMMGLIALKVPFWRFTLQGQVYAGQNLGGIQAGCGQTVIYHPYGGRFTEGDGVRTIGGFVDLGYQLTEKWRFAIGFGCDNPCDDDVDGGVNPNGCYGILYNDRVYIDAFYKITPNFKIGVEYARLLTRYSDVNHWNSNAWCEEGGDYSANRLQFSAFFDF